MEKSRTRLPSSDSSFESVRGLFCGAFSKKGSYVTLDFMLLVFVKKNLKILNSQSADVYKSRLDSLTVA